MRALLVDYLHGSKTRAGSGLGSTFYKLDAAAEAKTQGWELDYLTKSGNRELVRSAGVFREIHTAVPDNLAAYEKIISLGVDTANADIDMTEFNEEDFRKYRREPHPQFWRMFLAAQLGYEVAAATPLQSIPILHEPGLALPEFFSSAAKDTRWLAISVNVVSPLKYYDSWEAVAEGIRSRDPSIHIVYVGSREMDLKNQKGIYNLSGKTNLAELIRLIAACDATLGADGLPSHLAMRLNIPSLILFSMISPEDVLPEEYAQNEEIRTLLKRGCPHQYCYSKIENYRTDGCLLDPELGKGEMVDCMQFPVGEIVEQTIALLDKKP